MANTIISIRSSGVIGNTPNTLQPGELAINYGDGKLYYGNSSSQVELFSAGTTVEPAGLNGEIQFNDFGSFGSSAGLKYDTANNVLISSNISVGGINVTGTLSLDGVQGSAGQVLTSSGSGSTPTWTTAGSTAAGVTISDTTPSSPSNGDLWWKSDEGILKIYYVDINSAQWVDASPASVSTGGSSGSVGFEQTFLLMGA